uniref:DUF3734 domain-containing protein n=2 Tax=Burkholderia multivorans TaxID=87883 RepID=UPI00280426E0|nr:DUF3734 domain-containing protein [Burkholderia multivorans]
MFRNCRRRSPMRWSASMRAIADDPRLAHAASRLSRHSLRIVPVDYCRTQCETHFKDGQFGKAAIAEHWENGRRAAEAVLAEVG